MDTSPNAEPRDGRFAAHDGLPLYYQRWGASPRPAAVVVLVHGFGEHSGRYQRIVHHLAGHRYRIYAYDHRGHGRSPGQRGHVRRFSDYASDLELFLALVRRSEGRRSPLFLFGHSMGALIVLDYLAAAPRELAGAILSGAPLDPRGVGSPALVLAARALSRLWPSMPMTLDLGARSLSRDPEVQRAYADDPLVHHRATPRWGTESMATLRRVRERAARLQLPLLFVHGGDDPLGTADGVSAFVERIPAADKTLYVYPGRLHEVHNDYGSDVLLSDLEQWLTRHAAGPAGR